MEDYFMRRLLTSDLGGLGSASAWLAVAYLLCLFGIALFRPQQLRSPYLFRVSYILFAISLILPSFVDALVQMAALEDARPFRGGGSDLGLMIVSPLFHMMGKVLFGVSVICGFGSLRYRPENRDGSPMHIPPADQ
jgi:hypothetical protein